MPFQSIFINAFQNDIENNQLWQQTAAALQSNKFVQVSLKKKTKDIVSVFKKFCDSTDLFKRRNLQPISLLCTLLMFPI